MYNPDYNLRLFLPNRARRVYEPILQLVALDGQIPDQWLRRHRLYSKHAIRKESNE
jgi:hypothetical protein